jgi:hypothetical protein
MADPVIATSPVAWGALLAAVGSLIALVKFWVDLGRQQGKHAAKVEQLESSVRDAKQLALEGHAKVAVVEATFGIYRERIAAEYVSRQTLREVEDRISTAIENLGVRLDRAFEDRELRRQK